MRAKRLLAAALLCGACSATDDGGLNMSVAVQGLTATENFCFTWKLYEQGPAGGWALVDQQATPICGQKGVDVLADYATCTDGKRFLVEYNVAFYKADVAAGTAVATSGGTETDLCVKSKDTPTTAHLQYANEGNKGGVNPGIDIDQVCWNDKLVVENGKIVSALWIQPDSCAGTTPDDFCSFGREGGGGLTTVREGVTSDGSTRFIFSTADPNTASFLVYYLAFDPGLAADTLYLYHAPWVLTHYDGGPAEGGPTLSRNVSPAIASFRYNNAVGVIEDSLSVVVVSYDFAASCNGPVELGARVTPPADDGLHQFIAKPACPGGGLASAAGVIPTSGSEFQIVFECAGGVFRFVNCDAAGVPNGTGPLLACEPPI